MDSKIMRTTGYSFDGYYVDDYIDVISEEVIFRNSLMKQLTASVMNFVSSFNIFDTEVSGSSQLIENGKKYVLERFTEKARDLGGNAILGIQFESSFGVEVIRIAISGTVVHISPNAEKLSEVKVDVPVKNSNKAPVIASAIRCKLVEDNFFISLDIYNPKNDNITGVLCDIVFHTEFDEISIFKDQSFINFSAPLNNHNVSEPIICEASKDFVKLLSKADVMIKKCIMGTSITEVPHTEINSKDDLVIFETPDSNFNAFETYKVIRTFSNAKEIYAYLLRIYEEDPNSMPLEWMDKMKKLVHIESMYGNSKKSCLIEYEEQWGPFT